MARLICLLTSFLLALPSWAHFLLNYPPSIGFDDSLEGTAPCGGFTPDFGNDTVTDFFAGGSAIALSLAHPQANWLFRGTLDHSGAHNWVALFPIVEQSGLGNFCEPAVPVPDDWVGQKGLIGVVADALDGLLYQVVKININPLIEYFFPRSFLALGHILIMYTVRSCELCRGDCFALIQHLRQRDRYLRLIYLRSRPGRPSFLD